MSEILSQKIKVALIQMLASSADKRANLERAALLVGRAMEKQPDTKLVVLPELFNAPCSVHKFREYAEIISDDSYTVSFLSNLASKYKITLVGGSMPEIDPLTDKVYNTALVFNEEGTLVATHRKVHLFDIDIPNGITFTESDSLSAGSKVTAVTTPYGNIGIAICYDLRFPELAMIAARRENIFAMVYPAAFNLVTGPLHWHLLGRARAADNQIYTLLCAPARNLESEYKAYGHSLVCDPKGEIVTEAGDGEDILFAELDPDLIESVRKAIPLTKQRRYDVYPNVAE